MLMVRLLCQDELGLHAHLAHQVGEARDVGAAEGSGKKGSGFGGRDAKN